MNKRGIKVLQALAILTVMAFFISTEANANKAPSNAPVVIECMVLHIDLNRHGRDVDEDSYPRGAERKDGANMECKDVYGRLFVDGKFLAPGTVVIEMERVDLSSQARINRALRDLTRLMEKNVFRYNPNAVFQFIHAIVDYAP